MSKSWTIIATLKTKMDEAEPSYIASGLDVLNSYSTNVTNLAIKNEERRVMSSSSSSNSYQGDVNASTNDEEDVSENALTVKEIVFGMASRATEGYTMLKVVEYLLETLDDWKQDDSENTIYRRIATIFDFMFRGTSVKLADGETACDRSKYERQYNDIIFGGLSTDRELCGRKIDLLIRYGKSNKDLELSSIEFKKPSVAASAAIAQQCKNLRVNGAILNHLQRLDKKVDSVLAMDWIGSTGYIYCLIAHRGVYVAKLVDILTIPTSINGVQEFENTLRLLFAYKDFTLRTGAIAEHSLEEKRKVDRFREVIDVAVATPSPAPPHEIFFTPTTHRVKRTKTEDDV